ncbi:response regulator [Altererythrobacter sp. MF3-039]|uniref:response regulator n=1 Tax=Altererythrobacter sp. MF3-039 TaxID=3252901 RepID=UPI00390C92B4
MTGPIVALALLCCGAGWGEVLAGLSVRIIIADDHPFLRRGLKSLLADEPRFEVVGEAADGLELIAMMKQLHPDLVITDIAMPHLSGLEAVVEIERWCPECRIIVVTGLTGRGLMSQIDQTGVAGIFLKSDPVEQVRTAIDPIMEGKAVRSGSVLAILEEEDTSNTLTGREIQVLMGIARGKNNARIADRLGISASTVDKHRTNMMRKLDVHSAAGLLAIAVRDGLLDTSKTT